ncbi:MAG TPA: penicillin-binding transpeptidase domain-containing protein, partial [Candidatus Caenarcaniphilales bacterium]
NSINVVAVKVLLDVGFDPVIKLAHQMGIQSQLQPIYSLALGSTEVNLLELTSAYGVIADQGVYSKPHGIRRVINRQGEVIYSAQDHPKRVLDPGTAAITTWMLEGVVLEGTGSPAQIGRPVAGKTGTSEEARDLWFVGYIPQLVAGVWLGNDDNHPTWGSSGTAAYTWREFMAKATREMPVQKFPPLPKLEGRKGSIKAKPIHPKNAYTGTLEPEASGSYSNGADNQEY